MPPPVSPLLPRRPHIIQTVTDQLAHDTGCSICTRVSAEMLCIRRPVGLPACLTVGEQLRGLRWPNDLSPDENTPSKIVVEIQLLDETAVVETERLTTKQSYHFTWIWCGVI